MGAHEHKKHSIKNINFAVVTISDTRTKQNDHSGIFIQEILKNQGHNILDYDIIKDEKKEITSKAKNLLLIEDIQSIIFTGGTGISSRDITIDAIKPLIKKELPGFGEIFRMLSMDEIGSAAIMSRAICGIAEDKIIFCIPGSKGAVKLAIEQLILKECGHMLWEINR